MLDVQGVTVRFGERLVLDQVDLEVGDGELVSLLGPSGSGKSTLLRAVAGLQPIVRGTIRVAGEDMDGRAPHERGIGLVFQDQALFPHRDVGGNIGFGLRMQGRSGREIASRVAELLELVGLAGTERRLIATLSGGEQQRVALARALAPAPRLLMLDEPLGALDRSLRDRLVVELKSILRTIGISALSITHDHAEAFAFADRVIVMAQDGTVAQTGAPSEVWQHPVSAAVARFLGFTNVVEAEDGTAVLIRPQAVIADPAGPLAGTVIDRTFAGDGIDVVLAIAGSPHLTARWPIATPVAIGDTVNIRIDPTGVVPLGRAEHPHGAQPLTMELDDERVQSRADLLPEEEGAGSADPEAQAEAILADSDARSADLDAAPGTYVEHRTSDETVEPPA